MNVPDIYFPYLGLSFYIDSVAFTIGNFKVYWYGLIMAGAIWAGLLLAMYLGEKEGMDKNLFLDYTLYTIPFAVIGARVYFVIFHWEEYRQHIGEIFHIRAGGMAIYGSVIAAVIVAWFFSQYKHIDFLHFADISVMGLTLGQVIGRYGNFFNKEAYGRGTHQILAMALLKSKAKGPFTPEVLNAAVTFPQFQNAVYLQVHPTFFYESCWNLGLLILLLCVRKHRRFNGELFFLYLIGYGVGRFWIEGLRTDQLLIWKTTLPVSQVVSVSIIIMGIIGINVCRKEKQILKK